MTEEFKKYLPIIKEKYGLEKIKIVNTLSHDKDKPAIKIKTNNGIYKCKFYKLEQNSQVYVDTTFEIFKFLQQNNFLSPKVMKNQQNEFYVKLNEYTFSIIEFIEGTTPQKTKTDYFKIGEYLGNLHSLPVTQLNRKSSKDPQNSIKRYINSFEKRINNIKSEHKKNAQEILQGFKDLSDFKSFTKKVCINGDLLIENIVKNNKGEIVIIDWDFAGLGVSAIDIADFIINNCLLYKIKPPKLWELENYDVLYSNLQLNKKLLNVFIRGYLKRYNCSKKEKDLILSCMKFYTLVYSMENEPDTVNIREFVKYRYICNNPNLFYNLLNY